MLVTFTTPSHADITLFGDVAASLLKMMGQSGNVPGAIMPDDVGPALDSLNAALAARDGSEEDTASATGDDNEASQKVKLDTRAVPLIELLQSAKAAGDNVVWDK